MTRNFGFIAPALLTLGLVTYACTSGEIVTGPVTGTAGSNPVGQAGTTGAGQAGTTGAGQAGTTGAGQAGTSQAGVTGSRGGTTGQAGVTGSRGGTTGQAGVSGAGTAGTTGSTCPPTFSVSSNGFVQMPITGGCWSGYPYTYADSFGTMVMPTPMMAFTTNMLRLTGNIVAVSGSNYSYAGIGFSVGQTASGETPVLVTPPAASTGLTFMAQNSTSGTGVIIRAQVTNGTTTWCKDMTTFPATIPWSGFTVNCYSPGGAAYNKEPIKGIEVNIAGGTAAGTINLTITGVTLN